MVRAVHKLFRLSHSKTINALPKAYIDFLEKSKEPRERVHDEPPKTKYLDYDQDHDTGYVYRVPDHPVHVTMPPNSEKGLWGGVGMVEGFEKPKRLKPRITRVWAPTISKQTFYSEILDVHINIEVTERTIELIDKNKGFDFYILATPVQDLVSEFGRRLQHKMYLALAMNTDDYIKEKYKNYIRPLDEVSWHGLKEHEAITKFKLMRVEESIAPPLKVTFAKELINQLRSKKEMEASKDQGGNA